MRPRFDMPRRLLHRLRARLVATPSDDETPSRAPVDIDLDTLSWERSDDDLWLTRPAVQQRPPMGGGGPVMGRQGG